MNSKEKYTVYLHTVTTDISNEQNNKYYVGITKRDVKVRWRNGDGYIKNDHFYRAIQKYGWDNIKHEIIASDLSREEACNMEKELIKKYNSNNYHYGYNMTEGGDGKVGCPTSDLQKQVTSERLKKAWKDPEYREKMSRMSSEYQRDEKIKEIKSIKVKERWKSGAYNNMVASQKKKWKDPEYKAMMLSKMHHISLKGTDSHLYGLYGSDNYNAKKVVCLNTKEVFDSMVDANNKYPSALRGQIGEVCHNRRKRAGESNGIKLAWAFYDDYLNMTEEDIRLKIKEANARPLNKNSRMVINLEDKTVFLSQANAGRYYGITNSCNIGNSIRGGYTAKGFHWQFLDDYLEENNMSLEEAKNILNFIEE